MKKEILTPNPCKCGRNVKVERNFNEYCQRYYYIRCPKCGRETCLAELEKTLIQEWNKEDSDWVVEKGDNTLWIKQPKNDMAAAVSKDEELKIRNRILKCMEDATARMEWCCANFLSQHPNWSAEVVEDLYKKCHRAVMDNLEIEK